ncbi:MAG: peptidylprolyl isomerase [Clostridia bacterium]|nr:peptidylprolyl isomerase [Clostridia bacterium]
MSKKIKCFLISLALAVVVALTAALSACTIKTKHPRAEITVEFNGASYKIEYTLYRNMYPQTVQHFIELADSGFYNNMIIHDYKSNDWFTGAYSYNADETITYASAYSNGTVSEYLEKNYKEEAYYNLFNSGALSASVYENLSYDANRNEIVSAEDALPTLIGEFSKNDHNIEKNPVTASYGVLKMFYYDKGDTNQKVAVKNSFGQLLEHDYKYNCATSVFAIQTGSTSSYTESNYCTFARLRNEKNKNKLDSLVTAISDYIEDITDGTSFSSTVSTTVDKKDRFANEKGQDIPVSFTATRVPLVIKSVKITKY